MCIDGSDAVAVSPPLCRRFLQHPCGMPGQRMQEWRGQWLSRKVLLNTTPSEFEAVLGSQENVFIGCVTGKCVNRVCQGAHSDRNAHRHQSI